MNIGDKRAQICAMGFIPVAASVVKNMPGVETIQVSGEWTPIPVSSGGVQGKERCRGIDGAGAESGGY